MKDLVNRIIANVHVFLFLYIAWDVYLKYEEHSVAMEQVESQFPGVRSEIAKNQEKVNEIQDFIKKADEYKVRVEEVAKNIELVQRQLPAETNDGTILTHFQREMETLNIKNPALTPGAEDRNSSPYFISRDYSIKADGTFLQFLVFIERLGNADRIYNIKSLRLVNANVNQKGRFQVISGDAIIQAYRFNPDFKVDRGIPAAPTVPTE